MRHAFLVALFLCIAGHAAQAQDKPTPATGGSDPAPEVFVVEDDGKGALLIFIGGDKVARCAAVDQKFDCETISARAEIVPTLKPAPEGAPAGGGAP